MQLFRYYENNTSKDKKATLMKNRNNNKTETATINSVRKLHFVRTKEGARVHSNLPKCYGYLQQGVAHARKEGQMSAWIFIAAGINISE